MTYWARLLRRAEGAPQRVAPLIPSSYAPASALAPATPSLLDGLAPAGGGEPQKTRLANVPGGSALNEHSNHLREPFSRERDPFRSAQERSPVAPSLPGRDNPYPDHQTTPPAPHTSPAGAEDLGFMRPRQAPSWRGRVAVIGPSVMRLSGEAGPRPPADRTQSVDELHGAPDDGAAAPDRMGPSASRRPAPTALHAASREGLTSPVPRASSQDPRAGNEPPSHAAELSSLLALAHPAGALSEASLSRPADAPTHGEAPVAPASARDLARAEPAHRPRRPPPSEADLRWSHSPYADSPPLVGPPSGPAGDASRPSVVIHIGRVEVRAVTASPPAPAKPPARRQAPSLDEFIARQGGRK